MPNKPDSTVPSNMYRERVVAPLREVASVANAANALGLPSPKERQPDLQYLTAIFVSTGMNRNGAVFLGSELLKARDTIPLKAVDIEHDETSIIGSIVDHAYLDRSGESFNPELAAVEKSTLEQDEMEMDIAISAIIHKARFPMLAQEVEDGEWMVSMEAFYQDYDIKVGDLILPKDEAVEKGYDKLVGSVVHVKEGHKDYGFHLVGRVLRGIVFAGVGLVKNPANPRSVILEAAAVDEVIQEAKDPQVIDLTDTTKVKASEPAEDSAPEGEPSEGEEVPDKLVESLNSIVEKLKGISEDFEKLQNREDAHGNWALKPGTCVNYKKYVFEYPNAENDDLPEPPNDLSQYPQTKHPGALDTVPPDAEIAKERWCALFDLECSSTTPGDATSPTCWRNVFAKTVDEELTSYREVLEQKRLDEGLVSLQRSIDEARKFNR